MLCTLTLGLTAIVLIGLYQVYRFVIRPQSQLAYYKNQGLPVIFAPFYGFLKLATQDLLNNKDILHSWKQLNYLSPKPRAFASNFGTYPLVALKDPELIKQFYMNQEKFYIKAPATTTMPGLIIRNATIVAEGDLWKQHRKLSNPLYNYDNVKGLIPDIVEIVNEQINKFKPEDYKNFVFRTRIQHLLLEITGKLFLGLELSALSFKGKTVSAFVADLIDRAGLESLSPLTILLTTTIAKLGIHPRHKQLIQDINDLRGFLAGAATAKLQEILANKDTNQKKPLLLQVIYEQMVKMDDKSLTAIDLVDEFALFAMGSMDTTSHCIDYASYFILQNTEFHTKLMGEVNNTFKDLSQVNIDSLNQMSLMSAAIKETLRMAAPLPYLLPRIALEDHTLGDLKIKAGTMLVVAAVTNCYDPEYHDEPNNFKPERWIDENSRTTKSLSKNSYLNLSFSTGARTCPGQHLGTNLARIVLSLFMKKFSYAHADKNYEFIFGAKFFSEPHNPLVYNLEAKN